MGRLAKQLTGGGESTGMPRNQQLVGLQQLRGCGGESRVTSAGNAVDLRRVIIHVINIGFSHFNSNCHVCDLMVSSHFVNSHFVNSHLVNVDKTGRQSGKLTKWE